MNLEALPEGSSWTPTDTTSIFALWLLLAFTIYFVVSKTLRGFYKKSEKEIADNENLIERKTERI